MSYEIGEDRTIQSYFPNFHSSHTHKQNANALAVRLMSASHTHAHGLVRTHVRAPVCENHLDKNLR